MRSHIKRKLRNILAVAFVTASTFVFGQTYTLNPGDSLVDVMPFNNLYHFTIQQPNISGQAIVLSWEQISVSVPVGWTASLCDNGNCFTNFPLSGTMDTVSATDYGLLAVAIDPSNIAGTATIRYAVWDVNTPFQKDTLTWIISANGSLSIGDLQMNNSFSVFPTVVNSDFTITSNSLSSFSYSLSDQSGKIVLIGKSEYDFVKISVSELAVGFYFVTLQDEFKNRYVQKIIIGH